MTDLLVKLYAQPDAVMLNAKMAASGIVVRRAMASEKYRVIELKADAETFSAEKVKGRLLG
jgi:hypothetical protein